MSAGIWSDFIGATTPVERHPGQICTLDGMSASGGVETAIQALPQGCSLVAVGAPDSDALFLRAEAEVAGRGVYFTGPIPETGRRTVLAGSEMLVAAHVPVESVGWAVYADPFASVVLLEALGCDTLPLASDVAPHVEVMNSLGLSDFVFPAGRHDVLRTLIERVLATPPQEIAIRKARARARVRQSWLWDDYWLRVCDALRLETPEPKTNEFELLHPRRAFGLQPPVIRWAAPR